MPAIPFIPLITAGIGTAGSVYASKKAAKAAKLPPEQQAQQDSAMREYADRMNMMKPIVQGLVGGMQGRLAASQGGRAPTIGEMQTPGVGRAVSQLAGSPWLRVGRGAAQAAAQRRQV